MSGEHDYILTPDGSASCRRCFESHGWQDGKCVDPVQTCAHDTWTSEIEGSLVITKCVACGMRVGLDSEQSRHCRVACVVCGAEDGDLPDECPGAWVHDPRIAHALALVQKLEDNASTMHGVLLVLPKHVKAIRDALEGK